VPPSPSFRKFHSGGGGGALFARSSGERVVDQAPGISTVIERGAFCYGAAHVIQIRRGERTRGKVSMLPSRPTLVIRKNRESVRRTYLAGNTTAAQTMSGLWAFLKSADIVPAVLGLRCCALLSNILKNGPQKTPRISRLPSHLKISNTNLARRQCRALRRRKRPIRDALLACLVVCSLLRQAGFWHCFTKGHGLVVHKSRPHVQVVC